ncbi:helix-turn-helix domain-containing protein [Bacillus sp. FJAT-45350]|uniref:helix-turn-helix domain-containing protein n=1 Tax=Bacillus sp. FJAT-45350 TaxID=2011014 RepID=UPI000BB7C9CA|nr:helix-turn-helix domain-containing protein [Bacillus sp. FJAT-45350]
MRDERTKRSRYTRDFKVKIVKEAMESGNKSLIARRYVLSVGLVHRWVVEYQTGKLKGSTKRQVNNNLE